MSCKNEKMWVSLLHLGMNMWTDPDAPVPEGGPYVGNSYYSRKLRCDRDVWTEVTNYMPTVGLNTILIDIGEAVIYDSHPELAIEGSWTPDELKAELARLRSIGLEPLPKLNFSACHDAWLGEYSKMVSSKIYLDVVRDLINEVCEIFDKPRYFHLGMDEETWDHQSRYGYCVVRGEKLWWHDLLYMVDICEKNGARAWVWSDYYWHHPEVFVKNMPKTVVQSNWGYGRMPAKDASGRYPAQYVQTYVDFAKLGYDQIPTSSTWSWTGNTDETVRLFVRENMVNENLLGFMTAPWQATEAQHRFRLLEDTERLGAAKKLYFGGCCK